MSRHKTGGLVGMLLTVAAVAWGPVQSTGAAPPTRRAQVAYTSFEYVAAAGEAPTGSQPTVVPTVKCRRRGETTDTFWFGYVGSGVHVVAVGPTSVSASGAVGNEIVELRGDVIADATVNRGQVDFFAEGTHSSAFSVTVARGDRPRWSVSAPAWPPVTSNEFHNAWRVTVEPGDLPECGPDVPGRSATVQQTMRDGPATITVTQDRRIVRDGALLASAVRFDVVSVASACDLGGTPLAPAPLWGFDDQLTMASAGVQDDAPRDGFVPLAPRLVVRTDTFGYGARYERTWSAIRWVAHPQRPWINPLTGFSGHGLAATMALADVYGRCRYGDRVVKGTEPLWVPLSGLPMPVVTITDDVAQTTLVVTCTGTPGCPIWLTEGPGGVRWR